MVVDFGFWISDFGFDGTPFRERAGEWAEIRNPKSEIRNVPAKTWSAP